ncbi:unnamed protein product [Gongylonema pulchrum]|uniref:Large ribosomal subunit protein bL19m n=1 Tax=Gongylonema pulchrum TaxID=637853 RepID=A0A183E4H8_9BILA|nr:unnamed protein product [Gongylonema pulchrum]
MFEFTDLHFVCLFFCSDVYPDFQPTSIYGRRNALREELERKDMLERRLRIDIPEFYVGSIVAVTYSDKRLMGLKNRFLGICISRKLEGLHSQFTLRNVIEGIGVEVMYEMYTPTITKIEVIKLEKRLDDDLTFLIDAYPEYSTFDMNMEPTPHIPGKPVPVNPIKFLGSIVAVTYSDKRLMGLKNRFLGICISRKLEGLHSQFTLRNVIEGIGVEVMYEMYTPTITKIEVIKLEKRLDDDLTFLIDAYPEYSTFDMNMEPTPHIPGKPVPVNPIKVKLQPPPWTRRWELFDYKGIEDCWTEQTSYFKRKLSKSKLTDLRKYDLIADYREVATNVDEELAIEQEMLDFETKKLQAGVTKRKILRCAEQSLSQDV